jgi:deoxyribonuclease V
MTSWPTTAAEAIAVQEDGPAHPRRFGLACHLGVLTGVPSIGAAKTLFVGSHTEPDRERGATAEPTPAGRIAG